MENLNNFIGTRHSIKPKGEDKESEFKGISEKGVELSKERAEEVFEMINNSAPGTVMFFGGASDQIRTKSTSEVYCDEVKRIAAKKSSDILVINHSDIADASVGYTKIVNDVIEKIKSDPDKKVFVEFPMFIKEFALGNGKFLDESGNLTNFTKKILEVGKTEEGALKKWIEGGGVIDDMEGPKPEDVAKDHIKGIKRLAEFVNKNLGSTRPVVIGFVGHSWTLDVLAIYLANDGKVDIDGLEKVGGQMIKETQPIEIRIDGNQTIMRYNNQEFQL